MFTTWLIAGMVAEDRHVSEQRSARCRLSILYRCNADDSWRKSNGSNGSKADDWVISTIALRRQGRTALASRYLRRVCERLLSGRRGGFSWGTQCRSCRLKTLSEAIF